MIIAPHQVPVLPAGTNLLHIGPQKTGTTAIQTAMHRARPELAEHGVCYPGSSTRPAAATQVRFGFSQPVGAPKPSPAAWEDLLAELAAARDQRVCLSHEAFGRAKDHQIPEILESLGGERPHVIAAARRYDRYLPSQWQQRVKARSTKSYEAWLRIVLEGDASQHQWRNVWIPHDTVSLLERWSAGIGLENVTLLVGDEGRPTLLPDVFERLLGLPQGLLREVDRRTNRSLGFGETELLRRFNERFEMLPATDRDYYRLVQKGLIKQLVTSPFPENDVRIPPVPAWAVPRVVELSDRRIEGLRELEKRGLRIIGDLEALRADPGVSGTVPDLEMISLETAVRSLEGIAAGGVRLRRQRRQVRPGQPRGQTQPGPAGGAQASAGVRLLRRARRIGRGR